MTLLEASEIYFLNMTQMLNRYALLYESNWMFSEQYLYYPKDWILHNLLITAMGGNVVNHAADLLNSWSGK